MRLVHLAVSGFRGFGTSYDFDLDADAVIVVGANGNGKTSLFDSILWCLSGRVPRLAKNDDAVLVSLFSRSGSARVHLRLRSEDGAEYVVRRTCDGTKTHVTLETPERSFEGTSADSRLIEMIWPEAATSLEASESFATVLARSFYLQQDLIRHFVEAATDDERFQGVSELVGAGRAAELLAALESEKRAWTRSTNETKSQLDDLRNELQLAEARLRNLKEAADKGVPGTFVHQWLHWTEALKARGVPFEISSPDTREAPLTVDAILKDLSAERLRIDRRARELTALVTELQDQQQRFGDSENGSAQEILATANREVMECQRLLDEEQQKAAERRSAHVKARDDREEMKALASLALRHLTERCPVCDQDYDRIATRARLESLISEQMPSPRTDENAGLEKALVTLSRAEHARASAVAALKRAETLAAERIAAKQLIARRLSDLGLDSSSSNPLAEVMAAQARASNETVALAELIAQGEQLALWLTRAAASAAVKEAEKEMARIRGAVENGLADVTRRTRTGDIAQQIIEALRESSLEVVAEQVKEIQPVLQGMYARIDPHPVFRMVNLLSTIVRGKGKLRTVVGDPVENKESTVPGSVLSSSQLNALAVCIFLTLNLGFARSPFSAAVLDDPLQSLDDINLLGLLDLLRRVKARRQLLISTHDDRFGQLLARKLRPTNDRSRTVVITLSGWGREGPTITTSEWKSDPVPLRLVAS